LYDIHNQRVEFYRPDNHGGERLVALDENGQFPAAHPFAADIPLWKDFCFITFFAVTFIKSSGVNDGSSS